MYFEKDDVPQSATKTYNSFVPVYDRIDQSEKSRQISVEELTPKTVDYSQRKAVDRVPFEDIQTIMPQSTYESVTVKPDEYVNKTTDTDKRQQASFIPEEKRSDNELNSITEKLFPSEGLKAPGMQSLLLHRRISRFINTSALFSIQYIIIEAKTRC